MDTILLKVPQVMAWLGVGQTKVYELMATGELRSVKVGRSRRISSEELERFIAELMTAGPVATTVVSARPARRRRSSSQSGK